MGHADVLALAYSVRANKTKSYVEASRILAQFVIDHQIALRGWVCECGAFNGEEKERHLKCRACERPCP